jgi:F-type H+-transporting ATPase subunit epsilon
VRTFTLVLASPTHCDRIEGVLSVTARDSSGSFGVLPGAFRRVTALAFGLATVRKSDGSVEYLAAAGGVFYFLENELRISTTNYIRIPDVHEIPEVLDQRLRRQEESIREIKDSLHHLDEEMLKRLAKIGRGTPR